MCAHRLDTRNADNGEQLKFGKLQVESFRQKALVQNQPLQTGIAVQHVALRRSQQGLVHVMLLHKKYA